MGKVIANTDDELRRCCRKLAFVLSYSATETSQNAVLLDSDHQASRRGVGRLQDFRVQRLDGVHIDDPRMQALLF